MNPYDEALIKMVDARIAAAQKKVIDYATVVSRDPAGVGATIRFDADSGAVDAKVFGHVHVAQDDRVLAVLNKGQWLIVGSFSRRFLGECSNRTFGPAITAVTSSSTFVDMPSNTVASMTKRYDATALRVRLVATFWGSVVDDVARTGVRTVGTPGTLTATTWTASDTVGGKMEIDAAFVRVTVVTDFRMIDVPAGDYTFTARWRRDSGTGELRMVDKDLVELSVDEMFRRD